MEKVILDYLVRDKLDGLVRILLLKGYFGFKKDAENYVQDIVEFIYSIPTKKHYPTLKPKYGYYYTRYQPNKNTTYYITFDIIEDYYFVQNVITNHSRDYPLYIMGI